MTPRLAAGDLRPPRALLTAFATNPACPPDLLDRCVREGGSGVAPAVAANPSTPPGLLLRLAATGDETTVAALARSSGAPDDLLATLAGLDGSRSVRPQRPWPGRRHLLAAGGEHPRCPSSVLNELTRGPEMQFRALAAAHPRCRSEALTELGLDRTVDVRRSAARNLGTPAVVLRQLMPDEPLAR